MHEMSLMLELINLVSEDASHRQIDKVHMIEVIVGDLSNVLPDALELAFLHLRKQGFGFIDEKAELNIIREIAKAKCQDCQFEFEPDYRISFCPKCERVNCLLISGETFHVKSYEGSEKLED